MKKCSKFILLVALAWSLGHVQAQIKHTNCTNGGTDASAIGNDSHGRGNYSFAAGRYIKANMNNSYVFGSGVSLGGISPTYLESPAQNSFLVGFENKPIFYAQLDSALSHRVGIGTTAPKTALDIMGTTRTGKLRVVNNTLEYTGDILGFYPVSENGGSSGGL